jgi:hypothetical protein
MKVISYLKGIPAKNKNPEKPEVLKRFIQGVRVHGDDGIASEQDKWSNSDVAVVQGFVHKDSPATSAHLMLRKNVIENQRINNGRTVLIDSNLFLYSNPSNKPFNYLRYSLDGVFPTTGEYFKSEVDPSRWIQIQRDQGVALRDWNTKGKHILICLQRDGGWSMGGLNVMRWLGETIHQIKQYTDRPIVVRAHPGDKRAAHYLKINEPNVKISNNPSIVSDLSKAHATVVYNSSPAVVSAIEGVPTFVTDPNPKHSQAYEVANTDLSLIESPKTFERQQWIEALCMSHWKFQELSSGKAWEHIRKFV